MHPLISAFSSVHTRMTDTHNKKQQLKVFPVAADDTAVTWYAFIREEVVSGPVYLIFYSCVSSSPNSYKLDGPSFDSRYGQAIYSSQKPSRQALGPTQPPVSRVPGREVEHSPPTCAEVKNECSYTPTPPIRLYSVYRDTLIIRSSLLTNVRTVPSNRSRVHPFKPLPTYKLLIAFLFL
jgi:hypothetical protein